MLNDITSIRQTYKKRTVKSFVCRNSRLPSSLSTTLLQGQHYCLEVDSSQESSLMDFDKIFGRNAERILEIGFGDGTAMAQMAADAPLLDFIGIEVFQKGIAKLLSIMHQKNLKNIRLIRGDAVEILANTFPDESLAAIHIFFADPWPKTRHKKRRLIQTDFIALLASKLKNLGRLHLATDCEQYAEHMMSVISKNNLFQNLAGDYRYSERPATRPMTKYEKRGLRLGHVAKDLIFLRSARSSP